MAVLGRTHAHSVLPIGASASDIYWPFFGVRAFSRGCSRGETLDGMTSCPYDTWMYVSTRPSSVRKGIRLHTAWCWW